jgi:hypothetical protein
MRLRGRFSLAALLVLVTVVALVLSLGQVRRQRLLREAKGLRDAGVTVVLEDDWRAMVWMPAPRNATLEAEAAGPGKFAFGDATYATADANDQLTLLRHHLGNLGVKHFLVDAASANGSRQQILFDLEVDEQTNRGYRLTD